MSLFKRRHLSLILPHRGHVSMYNSASDFLNTQKMAFSVQHNGMSRKGLLFLMITNRLKKHQQKGKKLGSLSHPELFLMFWLHALEEECVLHILFELLSQSSYCLYTNDVSDVLFLVSHLGMCVPSWSSKIYAMMFSYRLHQIIYLGHKEMFSTHNLHILTLIFKF